MALAALTAIVLSTSACGSTKDDNESVIVKSTDGLESFYGLSTDNKKLKYVGLEPKGEQITRTYDFSGFNKIDIGGAATIYFTQGDTYSVVATCDKKSLDMHKIYVDNGTLKFEIDEELYKGGNINTVTLRITAPDLQTLTATGACRLYADKISTKDFKLNSSGATTVDVKSLKCNTFNAELSGATTSYINIEATLSDITVSGASKGKLTIKGDKLTMDNSGANQMDVDFSGTRADVDNSGVSNMKLTVNCDWLMVNNSGVATITIAGTADNTRIEGSGRSNVKTTELNKF